MMKLFVESYFIFYVTLYFAYQATVIDYRKPRLNHLITRNHIINEKITDNIRGRLLFSEDNLQIISFHRCIFSLVYL